MSANQPIISHYQRHSFVEEKIAEHNEDANDYAFDLQNESSSVSPIKYKDQEPFVDEVRTMVKKSKKKTGATVLEQRSAPRNERGKADGWSQSSANNSFVKPTSNPLSAIKSRSFNQNVPAQNARYAQHSKLSSIISHNIQS